MRELGWSEAQIEAERRNAERINAAGGFTNWVAMCEAARIASEARGYPVSPERFKVKAPKTDAQRLRPSASTSLTGKKRGGAQRTVLNELGIPYLLRGGVPIVSRVLVQQAMSGAGGAR
ncbi:DUF4224 domain-containing protein [Thiomonas sp. FB-6]|uniref:DUF4224 domain-containing protein n=1 Tax=Thiomonas sp. FB-6 TaxID=1158291 RepID=UPI00036005DE|nr:DUF4224 domain-containing protein [Thiomonas sp. FB-6]